MSASREAQDPPVIPGHEYLRVLGLGGFADVFLYQQLLPRRRVAVKVLLSSSLDAESRRRFQAEANTMAQLSHHPSIVTIHHADIASDGRPYLVMEYCSRPGLGARYRSERIAVAEALRIGVRLAAAVETAHRAGILHRDIKPANVLTTDFGWPALTDFGIAEAIGRAGSSSIGMSVPWSPPELLADEPTGDARADVYSLAATVYSLLARRSPFEVPDGPNSTPDLIARIERAPLPPTGRGDVPDSLQRVLARAMDKDPARRFPSALAVARALVDIEAELRLPQTAIDIEEEAAPPAATVSDVLPLHGIREADQSTRVRPVTRIDGADVQTRPQPADRGEPGARADAGEGLVAAVAETGTSTRTDNGLTRSRRSDRRTVVAAPSGGTADRVPRRHLPRTVTGIAAGVVVAGALVAIAIAVTGAENAPARPVGSGDAATSIVLTEVPSPTRLAGSRSADGSVTFTWANPAPETDDHYLWGLRTATTEPVLALVAAPTVTVPVAAQQGLAPGTPAAQVCIEVSIVRSDGRASAAPVVGCVR
ncbi:MAG TPA: serine/threonine-protein kinase [Cellulomonadaceae bacterium]|nr:serine/threonine-protein kinase [Cellulomonadaceae bacterium]